MKKGLMFFIALVILTIPAMGSAMPPRPGPYVAGFLGLALPVNTDATSTQYGPGAKNFNDRVEFDPGILIGGSGGFDFGFVRIEGELAYRHGEISSITEQISNVKYTNVDGRVGVYSAMFNVFFDLHNPSIVTPYLGGGIGLATLYLDDTYGTATNTGYRERLYRSDEDTVFAYQAGAGLDIALTRMLSLDIGYRYFGTAKGKFNKSSYMTTELEFKGHSASVGIRVKF